VYEVKNVMVVQMSWYHEDKSFIKWRNSGLIFLWRGKQLLYIYI